MGWTQIGIILKLNVFFRKSQYFFTVWLFSTLTSGYTKYLESLTPRINPINRVPLKY